MSTPDFTKAELEAIRGALDWTTSGYFDDDEPAGGPAATALAKVYEALDIKPRHRRQPR